MNRSKTNSGFLYFLEKIVRSHPLLYFVIRHFIKYTNVFEEDANGVLFLNLNKKVNIIDVGASDGIASKFFNRKLKINKIICFEPNKPYAKILKRLNIKNLVVNTYGIGQSVGAGISDADGDVPFWSQGAGWVGVTTYMDCQGNLRVKSEILVATSSNSGVTTNAGTGYTKLDYMGTTVGAGINTGSNGLLYPTNLG